MSEVITIGLDLAKHVFQAHGADASGKVVFRKRLKDVLRYARSKPIVLTSDTDAACSVVTNTTTLAHQGRRGGVHPITAWPHSRPSPHPT